MTLRAEKSTRFPLRLPLMRPSFPRMRHTNDLNGAPERCTACRLPRTELFTIAKTSFCSLPRRSTISLLGVFVWSQSTAFMLLFRSMERFRMDCRQCVMSSCPRIREPVLCMMAGRAIGGITWHTSCTMSLGCENEVLNPMSAQSSSLMLVRMLCASMDVKTRLVTSACSASSSKHSWHSVGHSSLMLFTTRWYDGCGPWQCMQRLRVRATWYTARNSCFPDSSSFAMPVASCSVTRRREQKKHTLRRHLRVGSMKPIE